MLNKTLLQKTLIFLAIIAILMVAFVIYKPAHAPVSPETGNFEYLISNFENQKPKSETTETRLFFAGDIMLSRNVHDKMTKANDFTLPFKNVANEILGSDIAIANFESPFNDTGAHFVEGSLVFNADLKAIEGLRFAGFDLLSLANNHALDQGIKGLDFTVQHLIDNGIIPTGVINSKKEILDPVIEKNKLVFGFLSYSYTGLNDGGKTVSPYVSDFNNIEQMKGHTADIVIVSMHAGIEYTRTPSEKQIEFAHAAIDAGADFVIGHHPHWIQTIEQYNDKWIFYSLGNFVFDQMWSQDTQEGLTLFITYEHERIPDQSNKSAGEDKVSIKKIELKPVIIEKYCCPRWTNEEETENILEKINLTSPIVLDKNEEVNN